MNTQVKNLTVYDLKQKLREMGVKFEAKGRTKQYYADLYQENLEQSEHREESETGRDGAQSVLSRKRATPGKSVRSALNSAIKKSTGKKSIISTRSVPKSSKSFKSVAKSSAPKKIHSSLHKFKSLKSISDKITSKCCLPKETLLRASIGALAGITTLTALAYYMDNGKTLASLKASVEKILCEKIKDPIVLGTVLCGILSVVALVHTRQVEQERNQAADKCFSEILKQSRKQGHNYFSEDELCETANGYVGLTAQDFKTDVLPLLRRDLKDSDKFVFEEKEENGNFTVYWTFMP